MYIVGIHTGGHNSCVSLLKDNEVLFNLEGERLSNVKYDKYAMQVLNKIKDYTDHVDHVIVTGFDYHQGQELWYTEYIRGLNKTFSDHGFTTITLFDKHHEIHAATAFYNSGFDTALCVVRDGSGIKMIINNEEQGFFNLEGIEVHSAFIAEYPHTFTTVLKTFHAPASYKKIEGNLNIGSHIRVNNSLSEAQVYEAMSERFGFSIHDAGKVMGLSSYGKDNPNLFSFYKNDVINQDIFYVDEDGKFTVKYYDYDTFEKKADFAYKMQKEIQEHVAADILKLLEQTGQKNLCLSGGFFLNCVSNYNLLKNLPSDINIYVEPMSSDAGNAVGAAKLLYHFITKSKEIKKQENIYYGPKYSYTLNDLKNEKIKSVTPQEVAQIIADRNIVALYQGGSESGPRALGNRSILYDPRDPNGKDHVNIVKKREWFRPFAGSILKEHAKEWFDLRHLEESKYMMFAVDVIENKKQYIPAITHVDGTCRIQTVTQDQNKNYYDLINEFYKITNVPILFNTSFNLAGNAIVETLEDALHTLHNSEINYLYLPELGVIVENNKAI